jgi:hypothetical protein
MNKYIMNGLFNAKKVERTETKNEENGPNAEYIFFCLFVFSQPRDNWVKE